MPPKLAPLPEANLHRPAANRLPDGETEWLVTNGLGSYASGTLSGIQTRRYQGLLIAALQPPLGRTVLLARLEEYAVYQEKNYRLFTRRTRAGFVSPAGYRNLHHFRLEGTTPVWTYALGRARLEKRIWFLPGQNTVYITYTLLKAQSPLRLEIKAYLNNRNHHQLLPGADWQAEASVLPAGLHFTLPGGVGLDLYAPGARFESQAEWLRAIWLSREAERGQDNLDAHLHAVTLYAQLDLGQTLGVIATTETGTPPAPQAAWGARHTYEQGLLLAGGVPATPAAQPLPRALQRLVLAADQFIVRRPTPADPHGLTVLAGFPWFSDWGRDTMIALPGLTLAAGRHAAAASLLRTFAHYADQGMLPNRFPAAGAAPEYNTVDATLWYFEAIRLYHAATHDDQLLAELYPLLVEIIAWHVRGTRFGIQLDPEDGLLHAGDASTQLTWMDVKIGDLVVTPRSGKPVEINALWHAALVSMQQFAAHLGQPADLYTQLASRAASSFSRFWYAAGGYLYDVLAPSAATPGGQPDATLRPNQVIALSLPTCPLPLDQQRQALAVCSERLLTPYGLRSLDAAHPAYRPEYTGDLFSRDTAYHQGTVWTWLIGPYLRAHLRLHHDPQAALALLKPLCDSLFTPGVNTACLGTLSEIYDGAAPHAARGCYAQAWSVSEVLNALKQIISMINS